ncbi:MAG: AAA family ATPase [Saprospiraceae bacterium]
MIWKIHQSKDWQNLVSDFNWLRDMEGVPQDPIYHAEGDVATHTRMVVNALQQLPEYQQLSEQNQEILFAAVLLHDVEKRSTTVIEENGRITSRNHAKKGSFTTQSILYQEVKTPFSIRQQVVKLVRYHGLPLWFLDKPDSRYAVLQAAEEVDTKLLTILAKADVLGRICDDQEGLLLKVELFAEYCREQQCFGQSFPFGSTAARAEFFYKNENSPAYVPFEKEGFKVYLLAGLPGAGKDYFVKKHYADLPIVSLDKLRREQGISPTDKRGNGRVVQQVKEFARQHLRKQQSFVWNATNITTNMRAQLIDLMRTYGATVQIDYIEVPYRKLLRQNQNREYPIPVVVLEKMINKLEIPQTWEAIVNYQVDD